MVKPAMHSKNGYSLLEVLISTTIITMVFGAAVAVTIPIQDFYAATSVEETARLNAEIALDKIVSELKEVSLANGELIPADPADDVRLKFKKVTGITTDPPTVGNFVEWRFEYSDGETNDGVDNDHNGMIDDGRLVRAVYNAAGEEIAAVVVAKNVMESDPAVGLNGLSFTRMGSKIRVSISIEKPHPKALKKETVRVNYQSTVRFLD